MAIPRGPYQALADKVREQREAALARRFAVTDNFFHPFIHDYAVLTEEWVVCEWAARAMEKQPDRYDPEERLIWAAGLLACFERYAVLTTRWKKEGE